MLSRGPTTPPEWIESSRTRANSPGSARSFLPVIQWLHIEPSIDVLHEHPGSTTFEAVARVASSHLANSFPLPAMQTASGPVVLVGRYPTLEFRRDRRVRRKDLYGDQAASAPNDRPTPVASDASRRRVGFRTRTEQCASELGPCSCRTRRMRRARLPHAACARLGRRTTRPAPRRSGPKNW